MSRSAHLAAHLVGFAHFLRTVGIPNGPGHVIQARRALGVVDITQREEFYWALHSVFVHRGEHRELFRQAFGRFWRDPERRELDPLLTEMLADTTVPDTAEGADALRRVTEASASRSTGELEPEREIDMRMTGSTREVLARRDFEQMSVEEATEAKRAMALLTLPLRDITTRRRRPDSSGSRVDVRATLRASLRSSGALIPLRWTSPRRRPPAVVTLCDVSGSMSTYSRMLLHFLHALTNDRDRVHTFLFGTRLTNATRFLKHRDVDVALSGLSGAVEDWGGGTRIGACLATFNRLWSRRVLGHGAVVLLITDGLDRDGCELLANEAARLRRSCRRLIWLNPLLRYPDFAPLAAGVKAILPHVDEFRTVHNLESLAELGRALGRACGDVQPRPNRLSSHERSALNRSGSAARG
ncbi:MAG: VWA domain-containing protein [Gemmatimonadota bacterium]|nr:MAG: VWA domain-containing protein [Gemmatimonadota bacterium]